MSAEKLPLSVAFISFNEEERIGPTLASVAGFASEIIVVDSFSGDRTREIAESFGARVFSEAWKGFRDQKNSALAKCTEEWILCLDCDEIVSPTLQSSIEAYIRENSGSASGAIIERRAYYAGKLLTHTWRPDWHLRLVKRSANPAWEGAAVHEYLTVTGESRRIPGELYHYSYKDIPHHFKKLVDYARLSAESYHKRGRKFSLLNLLVNPSFAFFKEYFIRGAILDGMQGLIIAVSTYVTVFLKYAILWEIEKKEKREKK